MIRMITGQHVVRYLVIGVLGFLVRGVFAEPVFHDSFSTPSQSHQHWMALSVDNHQIIIADGVAKLENPSSVYSGFAIHALSHPLPVFSYSAKITSYAAGVGVFCRTGIKDGVMLGYAVVSGDDHLVLLGYGEDGPDELVSWRTPFTGQLENVLTLAGDGSDIAVFCNGFFQFSYPDTFGSPNGIAVLAPPKGDVTFDDVTLEKKMKDTLAFSSFSDSMKKLPKYFHRLGNGEIDTADETVTMGTGKRDFLYVGLDLPVKDFGMAVSCRFDSATGGEAGFFLGRKDSLAEEGVVPVVRIGVTATGRPTAMMLTSDSVWEQAVCIVLNEEVGMTGWQRFSMERREGLVRLLVESDEVLTVAAADSVSFSFGFYAGDSAAVSVKDFSCESYSDAATPVQYTLVRTNVRKKRVKTFFDLMGRVVAQKDLNRGGGRTLNGVVIVSGKERLLLRR